MLLSMSRDIGGGDCNLVSIVDTTNFCELLGIPASKNRSKQKLPSRQTREQNNRMHTFTCNMLRNMYTRDSDKGSTSIGGKTPLQCCRNETTLCYIIFEHPQKHSKANKKVFDMNPPPHHSHKVLRQKKRKLGSQA